MKAGEIRRLCSCDTHQKLHNKKHDKSCGDGIEKKRYKLGGEENNVKSYSLLLDERFSTTR